MKDKAIIIVDDGLATGASMRAAAIAAKKYSPKKIIVAVPVAAAETCLEFQSEVDETICYSTPEPFFSVGSWYDMRIFHKQLMSKCKTCLIQLQGPGEQPELESTPQDSSRCING